MNHSLRAIRVAVIIPVLNEGEHLPHLLARLRAMSGIAQIVVCDGGSSDDSRRIAHELGATVALLPSGVAANRGAQMAAGIALIEAEIDALWFLHADAWPHPQSAREIGRTLQDSRVLGGNFRLRFAVAPRNSARFAARVFERIARFQRPLGVYYGDSGLWMRREIYHSLGGFQSWPLFEDYDLVRRLEILARRKRGKTVCLALPLYASARRFEHAPWRVLRLWLGLQIQFSLGVAPEKLAAQYRRAR